MQEEIREGMEKVARSCEGDCEVCLGEQRMFLHKAGVVIKVITHESGSFNLEPLIKE